jgi:TetR/AcrR family transcriptional repressor of nem operon
MIIIIYKIFGKFSKDHKLTCTSIIRRQDSSKLTTYDTNHIIFKDLRGLLMNRKTEQKIAAKARILDSAAELLREKGLEGAGVAEIMKNAGLTHGGFYAHFKNKSDLVDQAFTHAMDTSREAWFNDLEEASVETVLKSLVNRYLSRDHRDNAAFGCPLPPLSADLSSSNPENRKTLEKSLKKSIKRNSEHIKALENQLDEDAADEAIAQLALSVGGMPKNGS